MLPHGLLPVVPGEAPHPVRLCAEPQALVFWGTVKPYKGVELLAELARKNIAIWGTDIWASDWNPMSPEQQLRLVMARLQQRKKGIVLLHDIKAQTAQMLPSFLRALKTGGYSVVQATG